MVHNLTMLTRALFFGLVWGLTVSGLLCGLNTPMKGWDLVKGIPFKVPEKGGNQYRVILFLSAVCPCSAGHELELADLARTYSHFFFMGVHSNKDESFAKAKSYFSSSGLPF